MNITNTIKIGYKTYDIQNIDHDFFSTDGKELLGQINHDENWLKLRDNKYPESEKKATFLHEIFHGIDNLYLNNVLTESQVTILANGLYSFIVDNPKIFKEGN